MLFLNYTTDCNIGDRLSTPHRYFPILHHHPLAEIQDDSFWVDQTDGPIIVGGGGILIAGCDAYYEHLIATGRPCVFWGGGTNMLTPDHYAPAALAKFSLAGIRDFGITTYPYLPDASCLHVLFNLRAEPIHDYVVYEHAGKRIPIDSTARLNNAATNLEPIIRLILSARCLITNSYHGAYWAMLLNRRVVLYQPDSNRFSFFKHKPPVASESDWHDQLSGDTIAPADYRDECIQLNLDFYTRFLAL